MIFNESAPVPSNYFRFRLSSRGRDFGGHYGQASRRGNARRGHRTHRALPPRRRDAAVRPAAERRDPWRHLAVHQQGQCRSGVESDRSRSCAMQRPWWSMTKGHGGLLRRHESSLTGKVGTIRRPKRTSSARQRTHGPRTFRPMKGGSDRSESGPSASRPTTRRCRQTGRRLLHPATGSAVAAQRVAFGTSGHRGSSFDRTFNEAHVLAISQAICLYRRREGIAGPLFIGFDTHALSRPAFETALEVLAANGVEIMISRDGEYTPTPAISHAILVHNRGRKDGLADGIVITPSHNPPEDGGFKYNPPNGGPADSDVTGWIEKPGQCAARRWLARV